MHKKLLLLVSLIVISFSSFAQVDSSGLRVSLLTCGTGDEIWEQFGHTAIRITDSVEQTDYVYNYGTFSFGEGFELQFMRGKLMYYVSFYPYSIFLREYSTFNRSVEEQVLNLTGHEKESIQEYLKENSKLENREYKYDFFFDNCATRIRDVFPNAIADFKYDNVLPRGKNLTFRGIMNEYFYKKHFERVGCNLLLGSRIDKVMTNEEIMFLPDYLRDGMSGATAGGRVIAGDAVSVLSGSEHEDAGINWMFFITLAVAMLTIAGLAVPSMKLLGNVMTFVVLFVTGLLGVLMVVMWLFTDHQGCADNYNVLWALPTNLFLAFGKKRKKTKYVTIAIMLVILSLILHLLNVQVLPLLEIAPILLSLLFVYATILKKDRDNA